MRSIVRFSDRAVKFSTHGAVVLCLVVVSTALWFKIEVDSYDWRAAVKGLLVPFALGLLSSYLIVKSGVNNILEDAKRREERDKIGFLREFWARGGQSDTRLLLARRADRRRRHLAWLKR